jgi:hypothetical protein
MFKDKDFENLQQLQQTITNVFDELECPMFREKLNRSLHTIITNETCNAMEAARWRDTTFNW